MDLSELEGWLIEENKESSSEWLSRYFISKEAYTTANKLKESYRDILRSFRSGNNIQKKDKLKKIAKELNKQLQSGTLLAVTTTEGAFDIIGKSRLVVIDSVDEGDCDIYVTSVKGYIDVFTPEDLEFITQKEGIQMKDTQKLLEELKHSVTRRQRYIDVLNSMTSCIKGDTGGLAVYYEHGDCIYVDKTKLPQTTLGALNNALLSAMESEITRLEDEIYLLLSGGDVNDVSER